MGFALPFRFQQLGPRPKIVAKPRKGADQRQSKNPFQSELHLEPVLCLPQESNKWTSVESLSCRLLFFDGQSRELARAIGHIMIVR